ncbi:MAG TPA: hypothetical protein VN081_04240 [Dongiaceae bacterium]|nr:hypothetical protein [Dongiaceae bacterium]
MNSFTNAATQLWKKGHHAVHRLWRQVQRWWIRQDHRYGMKWRVANGAAALLVIASAAIPLASQLLNAERYALSAETLQLVGHSDPTLSNQLTYNATTATYQFNADAVQSAEGSPLNKLKQQLGTASGKEADKSLYGLDVPSDFSKGVTYHDINSQLSFSLVPQFNAEAGKLEQGRLVFPSNNSQIIYTLKNNGLKEDIVVPQTNTDTLTFDYHLQLPTTLEAKIIPDSGGAVGVYSADPALFSNISYGSDADQQAVEKVRENSAKTHLVFGLPAPVIKNGAGDKVGSAHFELTGNHLSVVANGLATAHGPVTIDPSVIVTSTSDFQTNGNNDGMINFSTSGQISRGGLTGGDIATWASTTSFTGVRENAYTAAYNGYLYVFGGLQRGVGAYNTVQYAPINTDGTVGTWASTTNLPASYQRVNATVYNGYVYLVGGFQASASTNTVYVAPFNTNGTIGSWSQMANLPVNLTDEGVVAQNNYIYALGGSLTSGPNCGTASDCQNTVYYAPLNADGTVGTWNTTTSFTTARANMGAVAYNGYVYIFGGSNTGYLADSQYAKINSDGTIGTWTAGASFTSARNGLAAYVYNGYLYLAGGNAGAAGGQTDTQYAPIYANGSIGAWTKSPTLLTTGVFYASYASYNGFLYILGGYDKTVDHNTVQSAQIQPAGYTSQFATLTNSFSTAVALSCSVAYNGYLYKIGGSTTDNNNTNVTTVQYTALNATTGQNGSWSSTTALPTARGSSGCTIYNGRVYVVGGFTGATTGTSVASVLYNTINTNGTLGASWTTATNSLPTTIGQKPVAVTYTGSSGANIYVIGCDSPGNANCQAVYYSTLNASTGAPGAWTTASGTLINTYNNRGMTIVGKYLYVFGGESSSAAQTTVEYVPINADGTLGTSTSTASLPAAVAFNLGTSVNGCIYSVGGESFTGTSLSVVYYACPSTNGSIGSWNTAPSLTAATTDMGVTSYNGYLYGVGGWTTAAATTTQFARVNNGGSGASGAWASTTALAAGRAYQATAAYDGYIYIAGGASSSGDYNDVQYAPINANGSIGSWASTTGFTVAVDGLEMVAYNKHLYLIGGTDGTTSYATVQYAPINANGTIGSWASTTGFTNGRSNFSSLVYNGYLYVVGGHNSSSTNYNDVQYAPINANGTIGSWNTTSTFTNARYGLKAVAYDGSLYVVGGYDGTTYYNDVQSAPINANGTLGSWVYTSSFANSRYRPTVIAYNGTLYILGGRNGSTYYNDVQSAPIYASGTLGPWATTTTGFTNTRYGHSSVAYEGYLYVTGGTPDGGTTFYSDTQYAPLSSIAHTASYSKLIDLGVSANITSITYNGTVPAGSMNVTYRSAGTNAIFRSVASTTSAAGVGSCVSGTDMASRYIWVSATLDDGYGAGTSGIFADTNGTAANMTDLTINYTPVHPAPNIRLRTGQTLQQGSLSPLDTCSP